MKALVLYYAYDNDPETADPIAIIPDVVLENIDDTEVVRMFSLVREQYTAPEEHCRTAWVEMPDGARLFAVPELGRATISESH